MNKIFKKISNTKCIHCEMGIPLTYHVYGIFPYSLKYRYYSKKYPEIFDKLIIHNK